MICPKCGADNSDSATFCGLCLERFSQPEAALPGDGSQPQWDSADARALAEEGPHKPRSAKAELAFVIAGVVVLAATVLVGSFGGWADALKQYSVSHYAVTFAPPPGGYRTNGDVATTMRITYDIGLLPKSGGYKYVGTSGVDNVTVTDGDGRPLQFELDEQSYHEKRIDWHFPARSMGTQTVVVRFISHGVPLSLYRDKGVRFEADWPQNFSVPVRDATFSLAVPPGANTAQVLATPGSQSIVQGEQGPELAIHQDTLEGRPVVFQVGADAISGTDELPGALDGALASSGSWTPAASDNSVMICGVLLGGWLVCMGLFVFASRRGWLPARGGSNSSGGYADSGGGCGGCSGCGGCGG